MYIYVCIYGTLQFISQLISHWLVDYAKNIKLLLFSLNCFKLFSLRVYRYLVCDANNYKYLTYSRGHFPVDLIPWLNKQYRRIDFAIDKWNKLLAKKYSKFCGPRCSRNYWFRMDLMKMQHEAEQAKMTTIGQRTRALADGESFQTILEFNYCY